MLQGKTLLISAAFLLTPHCAPTSSPRPPLVSEINATAYNCGENCQSLLLEIRIENKSNEMYCISEDYGDSRIADYVTIIDQRSGKKSTSVRSTGLLPPQATGSDNARATWMLERANIIIQPKSSADLRTIAEDYFSFEKSPATASLKILYYPCARTAFQKEGAGVLRPEASIQFQQ